MATLTPTLATACAALPPEGAVPPWGGPAVEPDPTLATACAALPPEGAVRPWGGPAAELGGSVLGFDTDTQLFEHRRWQHTADADNHGVVVD